MGPSSESPHSPSLLSPHSPEDLTSSLCSKRKDQDTDSEDDQIFETVRPSTDIRSYDSSVLVEEVEADRLLIQEKRQMRSHTKALGIVQRPLQRLLSPSLTNFRQLRMNQKKLWTKAQRRRKERTKPDGAKPGENGVLMFEMEEGVLKSETPIRSSTDTEENDDSDQQALLGLHKNGNRRARWPTWCIIRLAIMIGFTTLVLLVWKITLQQEAKIHQKLMNNGTALFAPTTILISLDGFRADFLHRGITPRLKMLIKEGVSPLYMRPSFPSVTFPNHYTLVTGLHPESHGIVSNNFWDEQLKEQFSYTHSSAMDSKWWKGEPIWVTAEQQGVRTAIHMWPGSEAHIMGIEPSYLDKYNGKFSLKDKASRILELLDKPGKESSAAYDMRPQLIAAYVPNVDADGHKFGPNSTEIMATIANVDHMLDEVFVGLVERNLTDIVNVIIVSDHGMASTDINRLIQLDDLVNINDIEHFDGWPLYGLRPKGDLQELYEALSVSAASNDNFDIYLRDRDMPKRYHFSNNERIAPLWIVPKTGWAIVTKKEFDIEDSKSKGLNYYPRGLHGYDNENPLMRAIFIARGPAFPQSPNSRLEPFQNIEVYNIICDTLGVVPKPNNGTFRLPLLPIESDHPDHTDHLPEASEAKVFPTQISETLTPTSSQFIETSSIMISSVQSTSPVATEIPEATGLPDFDEAWIPDEQKELWAWLKGNAQWLKHWWDQMVTKTKENT